MTDVSHFQVMRRINVSPVIHAKNVRILPPHLRNEENIVYIYIQFVYFCHNFIILLSFSYFERLSLDDSRQYLI